MTPCSGPYNNRWLHGAARGASYALLGAQCRMLLTLHIVKIGSGDYRGHVMEGTQHLGNYDAASIIEAIMLAAENPLPDPTGFHIWYEHVCAGTTLLSDMRPTRTKLHNGWCWCTRWWQVD